MTFRGLLVIALASLMMATAAQANMSLPRSPQFPTNQEQCRSLQSKYISISRQISSQLRQCEATKSRKNLKWIIPGPCSRPMDWERQCAHIFERGNCVRKQQHSEFKLCLDRLSKYRSAQNERKKQEEHARRLQNASDMRTRLIESAGYIRANQKSRTDRDKFLDNLNLGLRGVHRAAPGPSIAKRFFDQSMNRINEQFKTNLALLDSAFAGFGSDPKMMALKNLTRVNLQIVALVEARRAEKTRRQAEAAAERRRQADLAAERQRQNASAQNHAAQATEQQRQAEQRAWQQQEWERQQRSMVEVERTRPTGPLPDPYDSIMRQVEQQGQQIHRQYEMDKYGLSWEQQRRELRQHLDRNKWIGR